MLRKLISKDIYTLTILTLSSSFHGDYGRSKFCPRHLFMWPL